MAKSAPAASPSLSFPIYEDGKPWFFHDITSLERLATLPAELEKP